MDKELHRAIKRAIKKVDYGTFKYKFWFEVIGTELRCYTAVRDAVRKNRYTTVMSRKRIYSVNNIEAKIFTLMYATVLHELKENFSYGGEKIYYPHEE